VNPTRARKRIRDLARAGAWTMTEHAVQRMVERDAEPDDVYGVLTAPTDCRAVRPGSWRLDGSDRLAEPLSLLAELGEGVLVVTLFRGDEP